MADSFAAVGPADVVIAPGVDSRSARSGCIQRHRHQIARSNLHCFLRRLKTLDKNAHIVDGARVRLWRKAA